MTFPKLLGPNDSLSFGYKRHPLPWPVYRIPFARQSTHATIWGRTGSGKSKLLQSLFLQHVASGWGACIIEPHHDLSFDTLSTLVASGFFKNEESYKRVIYLDWGNGSFVPFNVLKSPRTHAHTLALHVVEAMTRVWPELREAPTFQTLVLSSLVTLIQNDLPITSIYRLLVDKTFRRECLSAVSDPLIQQTFQAFDRTRDQLDEAGSALRRAFLMSFNPIARLTVGQKQNLLDFREIMDSGASIILNLGNINDSETRRLIGALLLVQIEQAALSRTDIPSHARRPFTVFVDEWPSFAAQDDTIGTILSQTRKFNLRLYLAAQSVAQISSVRLSGALENCRLNVVFGLGRDSAARQSQHIAAVDPMVLKEEAKTQNQHGQYISIPEQFESWTQDIMGLPPRSAYVKFDTEPAVRIRTLNVPGSRADPAQLEDVLATFKAIYQRSQAAAEANSPSGSHNRRRPFVLFDPSLNSGELESTLDY